MDKWKAKKRPVCLEKRFEFKTYSETRDFLDCLGSLSEKVNRFPDISFGKTYVNITLRPEDQGNDAAMTSEDSAFAKEIDRLIT